MNSLTMKPLLVYGLGFFCGFVELSGTVQFISSRYMRISASEDRYPSSNILVANSGVSSVSECSLMALNTSNCFSFFFNAATMSCTLTGRLCASQLTSAPGFQHFYTDRSVDIVTLSCAYEYLGKFTSWHTAKSECENRGGYLVELQSPEEQTYVRNILVPYLAAGSVPVFWLGGRKSSEGTFEWLKAGTIGFSAWRPGFPNAIASDECMIFADVDWKNFRCSDGTGRPTICEFSVY